MRYERPDGEALKKELAALAEKLDKAEDYGAARDAFLRIEELSADFSTLSTLVSIRHSIDTRDEFYDKENDYWNELLPELEEYIDLINKALLKSPFREDFEKEFGSLIFTNAEIALKTFSPEIIPLLQQENQLTSEYDALVAKARVPFEGKEYTIAQMGPFKI
ncbi:MAG: M3 family oligoendopeptidase, partial [Firmicutes bacterium]|nr:M3 family oligoendopeptidase [Bacillota bacterium]